MQNFTEMMQGATSMGEDHVVNLERVKEIASELKDSVEQASNSASYSTGASVLLQMATFILCPAFAVVLGSWGLPPSFTRNIGLSVAGKFTFIFSCLKYTDPEQVSY
jgi:hypothetical protein